MAYQAAPPMVDPLVLSWFQAVDTDRSGKISAFELQQALTNSSWSHFNAETCRLMVGMFDRDRSGTIDVGEFQALWTYIQQWKGVFDQFDRDRSGTISGQEYQNAIFQMGYRVSETVISTIVKRYNTDGGYALQFDNFIQSCVLLKTITDAFRQKDVQGTGVIRINYEEFLAMIILNKP